jgi:hypothetical protein
LEQIIGGGHRRVVQLHSFFLAGDAVHSDAGVWISVILTSSIDTGGCCGCPSRVHTAGGQCRGRGKEICADDQIVVRGKSFITDHLIDLVYLRL